MKGSCLCGAVRYSAEGEIGGFTACHCSQCRKQSGHYWASAHVADEGLRVEGEVRWFRSSEQARRGFCPVCGSVLFWKRDGEAHVSFSLGSVDGPVVRGLARHIFTADKGDYYEIADGIPQF